MINKHVNEICEILSINSPEVQIELNYTTLFELVIAVILSAQATDISVNKVTPTLFEVRKTPQDMLNLGIDGLKAYISTIGLYNNKASNIIKLCQELLAKYDGEVPLDFDQLIELPGIGRKSANVILNVWLNQPRIAVDTHVFRVSKRLNLAFTNTPEKVEQELIKNIPTQWHTSIGKLLVLHGRYVCKAISPKCTGCKIQHFCPHYLSHSTKADANVGIQPIDQ